MMLVFSIVSVVRAENLATDMATDDILQVRQIPGSNARLSSFFYKYMANDTIFAIMNPVANCPRCESMLNSIIQRLKTVRRDIPVVRVHVYDDSLVAKKYLERYDLIKDDVLFDTHENYKEYLSFATGYLHIPYLFKIVPKSGDLIIGIPADNGQISFLKDFCNVTKPMEKKEYPLSSDIGGVFVPSDSMLALKGELRLECQDSLSLSESDYMPEFYGNKLFVNDKLNECVKYFKIENADSQVAVFKKEIRTDNEQNNMFIQIPDSLYGQCMDMVRYMPLSPKMLDDSTLAVSYSLPEVWMEDSSHMAYRNMMCILSVDPDSGSQGKVVGLLDDEDDGYFYSHFNLFKFGDDVAIGCENYTWPAIADKEYYCDAASNNPFTEEFYIREHPIAAVFDRKNGEMKKRVGDLSVLSGKTKTGSYFVNMVMDTWGGRIAVADGFSGEIIIMDAMDGKEIKRTKAFDVPLHLLPDPDPDLFYTYDCVSPYIGVFNRVIEDIKISEDTIYCLVRYGRHGSKRPNDVYSVFIIDRTCDCAEEKRFPELDYIHKYHGLRRTAEGSVEPYALVKNRDDNTWKIKIYE